MSKKQKGSRVRDLPDYPLKADGSIDIDKLPKDENGMTEIDRSAEEAFENGELKIVDVLGNEEPFTKNEDIMVEILSGEEKPIAVEHILRVIKHLQGKILTIIDATFTDEKRIKYVKDLVKDSFSSSSQWLMEMAIRKFEKDLSKSNKK